jgi:hypothetical protein
MKNNIFYICFTLLIAIIIITGCTNSNSGITRLTGTQSSNSQSNGIFIKILYDEPWYATLTIDGSKKTYEGNEHTDFEVTGNPYSIDACVIKRGPSTELLTIQIIKNGQLLDEGSTSKSGGIVCIGKVIPH